MRKLLEDLWVKTYPLYPLLYHKTESLLFKRVWFTVSSRRTVRKTPSVTSSPDVQNVLSKGQLPLQEFLTCPAHCPPCPPQPSAVPSCPSSCACPTPHLSRTRVTCLTLSPPHCSSGTLPLPLNSWAGEEEAASLAPKRSWG